MTVKFQKPAPAAAAPQFEPLPPPPPPPPPVQVAPPALRPGGTAFVSQAQMARQNRALQTIGLPTSTPEATPTTLRTEKLGDGNSNCLERAMALAKPGDSVVLLTDSRDGVGHAIVRHPDGSIVDPNNPHRTFPDLLAYQSTQPQYGQPVAVPQEKLAAVLGTPSGPKRDALIQSLGLSAVANRLVADTYDMVTLTNACQAVHAAIDANRGVGAAHIMAESMRAAINSVRTSHPEWSTEQVMDYAVAATHACLVGPGNGLDMLNQPGARNNVVGMINAISQDPSIRPKAALDLTYGMDLRPEFNDTSDNQAFHCFFFVTVGYVANNQPFLNDVMGNVAGAWGHEQQDDGSSREDYIASNISIGMGQSLLVRGASGDMSRVDEVPEVMLAVYTPAAGTGPAADRARQMASERIEGLKGALDQLERGKIFTLGTDTAMRLASGFLDSLAQNPSLALAHQATYVLPITDPPDWHNPVNR